VSGQFFNIYPPWIPVGEKHCSKDQLRVAAISHGFPLYHCDYDMGQQAQTYDPDVSYYKFVAVRQGSSLTICSFSKALVGEYRAFSFL
jgi:hypothetical protein